MGELQPYANFKTAHFVKYLGSILMDIHKTFITGIVFVTHMKFRVVSGIFTILKLYRSM